MPNTSNRQAPSRDNRFNWPNKDNRETEEDKTTESDKECNCQGVTKTGVNIRNNEFNNVMPTRQYQKTSDDSLKIALIVIESILLGGSVMYLILNNITKEIKEETRTIKNKKAN